MNDRRQEAIDNLVLSIDKTREAFARGTKGCSSEYYSIMYGALTRHMQSNGLLLPWHAAPFLGLNYKYLVQVMSSLKSPVWCRLSSRGYYSHRFSASSFNSVFGKLNGTLEGFGLDDASLSSRQ
jgi:hypothetical protein